MEISWLNKRFIVVEISRDSGVVSETTIIEKLNSEVFFKRNTPSEIHSMYNRILKRFKNLGLVPELTADQK